MINYYIPVLKIKLPRKFKKKLNKFDIYNWYWEHKDVLDKTAMPKLVKYSNAIYMEDMVFKYHKAPEDLYKEFGCVMGEHVQYYNEIISMQVKKYYNKQFKKMKK